jgi:hypothetical protein
MNKESNLLSRTGHWACQSSFSISKLNYPGALGIKYSYILQRIPHDPFIDWHSTQIIDQLSLPHFSFCMQSIVKMKSNWLVICPIHFPTNILMGSMGSTQLPFPDLVHFTFIPIFHWEGGMGGKYVKQTRRSGDRTCSPLLKREKSWYQLDFFSILYYSCHDGNWRRRKR